MADVLRSVCPLDCPDTCAVLVHIAPDGRAAKLQGDPQHPVTRGFLCSKVIRYLDHHYSPDRLLYPQIRTGEKGQGRFQRVSWDEALGLIAERLQAVVREHGPEAVLPYSYAGTMGLLNGSGMDRRFFHRLGASRLDRTICASAGATGLMHTQGVRYGVEPERFRDARLIIAWGANIRANNVHLWPFILEAQRQGARLLAIDPVANRTTQSADRHYAPYPGSDLALALGLLHVIFAEGLEDREYLDLYTTGSDSLRQRATEYPPERTAALTGLSVEDIVELAREYATTQPSVIRVNYGVQRSERGGSAVRAIAMLPAVVGAWRHVGGGLQLTTSGGFHLNRPALERPDLQTVALGREARLLNMSQLAQVLLQTADPPVQAMVVYNSNPAAIAPQQAAVRQGLLRPDLFTVVLEQRMTDTAQFADVLLPATTFLEHTDLYFAYGHYYLQLARPVLPALGEARSNVEVFRELSKRMDFTEPCFDDTEDQMMQAVLDSGHPFLQGITLERLDAERSVRLKVSEEGEPFLPFAQGGYGHAEGKAQLQAEDLDYTPPVESRLGDPALRERFPLELISPKLYDNMNSTFSYRSTVEQQSSRVLVHPDDAAQRGIREGSPVRVYNERGALSLAAHVTPSVRPGVVAIPGLRRAAQAPDGWNSNVLTSERLTDLGGGPTFYSCLVEVEPCTA